MAWHCVINQPAVTLTLEILVRLLLLAIFLVTEELEPFHRLIQPEEMWLYKNPVTPSYVSTHLLFIIITVVPVAAIIIFAILGRDRKDSQQALLAVSLTLFITGVTTNCGKLIVGRPRPDFYWRCFPDGRPSLDMKCTGDPSIITEGRKSFPSGHSSFAFAGLGYASLYLAGKLHCFESKGRGSAWRLCLTGLPVILATCIALSRTADYHHHWQDVLAGSLLGFAISFVCYRQYYPPVTNSNCDRCYASLTPFASSPSYSDLEYDLTSRDLPDDSIKLV